MPRRLGHLLGGVPYFHRSEFLEKNSRKSSWQAPHMPDGKAAGSSADRPREFSPGSSKPRRRGWRGRSGIGTAARVCKGILTWFLEAKRWRKLNEDTPPCFLAVGELPSAAVLGRWPRYFWRLTMWFQILVLATATAIFAAEVRWLMRC
jgi:hypothetical protein